MMKRYFLRYRKGYYWLLQFPNYGRQQSARMKRILDGKRLCFHIFSRYRTEARQNSAFGVTGIPTFSTLSYRTLCPKEVEDWRDC